MFRKFKGLMALFAIICVTAIAGGSAYFYFGGNVSDDAVIDNSTDTPNDNEVKFDNILENYEFGVNKDLNETYTYYFFPSTLYMTDDFFDSDTMPETVFGYNEVILDDNGDPVLDNEGQPQYNIVKGNGIITKDTAQEYHTYYDYLANYLNNKGDSYLYPTATSIGNDYGISETTKGTHYFGSGLNGNDHSYNGYSLSLRDPYMLNNTDAYDFFLNNYNVDEFYDGVPNITDEGWGNGLLYSYNVLGKLETIDKTDEVLSPIAKQSKNYSALFDININTDNGLTIENNNNGSYTRSDLINVFSNLYQKGVSGETLNKNSLSQVEIHYNSMNRVFTSNFNTFSLISYGSGIGEDKGIGGNDFIKYNNEFPYVGTWVNSNDNMEHILTLYSGSLDEEGKTVSGTGYFAFYIDGEYKVNTFNYVYNIENNNINISGDDIYGSFVFKDGNQVSQMGNRAQYRNDRFGYWTSFYDWSDPNNKDHYIDNSASRYLPIKITVNGNLSPDDMAKVIPSLSTSMFDDHMWFDFSSNVWTYVTYANNAYNFGSKEYTTSTEGFTANDITNIFDIMQNPSKYADKDGNIRLFPVFSNGKNPGGSITEGGSDAIQASFTYNDNFTPSIANDLSPSSTKMTYSSYTFSSYYLYNVNYAVLKNIMITNNKFNELKIRIDTTDSAHNWTGKWTDIYTFSGTQLNNLISTYGEGLYTFYLFVGGRATDFPRLPTPFRGEDLISKVTEDSSSGNELYKKYLLPLSDDPNLESIVVDGVLSNKYVENDSDGIGDQARPVALAVEKVTNLRLVSDIPIVEGENGLPSANQDWDSIDGNIQQGLLNAKNFTIADEVYGFGYNIYDEDNIDLSSGERLDTSNPYIYFIQNADFRFVNNLYFQIRFSNDYINNAMNVTTDYSSITGDKPNKYVAYSVNGQILKFKFQDSDPEENDVFIQNASAGSGEKERQGFKLKDYNARGIYDILLVSHGTSGNSQQYYMYVNRHTNSFIKLFYGNPGTFEFTSTGSTEQQTGNSFVRHKLPTEDTTVGDTQTRVNESTLLWNGQTYLGEYLMTSTTGIRYSRDGSNEEQVIEDPPDASLYAAIRDKCGLTPGEDEVYKIIDAVTGRVVAYYNSGVGRIFTSEGSTGSGDSNDAINLFTIMKNYVLYIDPVPIQ